MVTQQLESAAFDGSAKSVRILYGIQDYPIVCVVGLGTFDKNDFVAAESARIAAAVAVKSLLSIVPKDFSVNIVLEGLGNAHGTAEGATLASYCLENFKSIKESKQIQVSFSDSQVTEWHRGQVLGQAQNLARRLKDTPANHLTPTLFAQEAETLLDGLKNVQVYVRDLDWIKAQKMGAFLSVANGSDEPPKFLELHYNGTSADKPPVALVGKGVTFDAGGISIKGSKDMHLMKADMGGAAAVFSSFWAIATLQLKVNVVACIPLTENMPNGRATKPGDVVTAMNGKTIEVQNTDAEGRLILADSIYYVATTAHPSHIVELSTLTGAMVVALGTGFAGVFTNSDNLWSALELAGQKSGDRLWRMPLEAVYLSQLKSDVADLNNIGGAGAGSCTAAIFLKEFLPAAVEGGDQVPFAHIDIAGVMHHSSGHPILAPGMSGRPTRAIIDFVASLEQ